MLFLLPFTLAGCATVSTTKTIEVIPQPGADHIVVDTNAHARCKDIFFIITCRVNIDMTPVGGMDSSSGAALPTASSSTPVTTTISDNTSDRLEELDKLKSKKLISLNEYKTKRNEILKGL
ncbi:hypothetical protein [Buttiauxella noackiae]|uniref:hypothetical protein n=1 Tax=Buttiauxella noackiae TaxID=82992 RepID=UPI0028D2F8C6|nr:hypothetical protein [Buttiauxella noackiae]